MERVCGGAGAACAAWQGTEDGAGKGGAGLGRQSHPGKGRKGSRDGSVNTGISAARSPSPCFAVRSGSTEAGTGRAVFPPAAGEHSDGLTFAPRARLGPASLPVPDPRALRDPRTAHLGCAGGGRSVGEQKRRDGSKPASLQRAGCLPLLRDRGWLSPQCWAFCSLPHPSTAFPAFASAGNTRLCWFF